MATFDANKAVGQALKALRKENGKTQGEVAEALGRTQASVSQLENGHRSLSAKAAYTLATFYEVPPGSLLPDPSTAADEAKEAIRGAKNGKEEN